MRVQSSGSSMARLRELETRARAGRTRSAANQVNRDLECVEENPISRPTPEMLADAHRRNAAPRPAVSWLMGDPAPGQSALDRRARA